MCASLHVLVCSYAVCSQQISELSVDVESKQKELQSVQQDKSSLEQQLTGLVSHRFYDGSATFYSEISSTFDASVEHLLSFIKAES